jgi:hypothetical protein
LFIFKSFVFLSIVICSRIHFLGTDDSWAWYNEMLKTSVFLDVMPCRALKVNWHFWGTHFLYLQGQEICQTRNQQGAVSKATCFSRTLVDLQWTAWWYIPEDRNLHNHCYESLRSYTMKCYIKY